MQFEFDETERSFQEHIRRYAAEKIAPHSKRWDQGDRLSPDDLVGLAELGLMGLQIPEEFGGVQASYVMGGIASEEIGRADHSLTLFVQITQIISELIANFGSQEVKSAYLPKVAQGTCTIAFALTEPGVGSDAASIRSTARREGDEWVISGEKATVSLLGHADAVVVFARTGGPGAKGISTFLVPTDAAGVTRRIYDSVGQKMSERGSLFLDNVCVPQNHMLGQENSGFVQAMSMFDYNRANIALGCIGTALQSIDETVEHARNRQAFGKPLACHEGYAFQIAEHATLLESARLLSYRTLWLRDRGLPHTKEAAMAKYLGPKTSAEAIHTCLVLNGWAGYDNELPHGQRLRDVIGLEIGDGTPEIMKGIVAREIFGKEFDSLR